MATPWLTARGPWGICGCGRRLKHLDILRLRSGRSPLGLERSKSISGDNEPYPELRIMNYEP
jgi:hypothetical protein